MEPTTHGEVKIFCAIDELCTVLGCRNPRDEENPFSMCEVCSDLRKKITTPPSSKPTKKSREVTLRRLEDLVLVQKKQIQELQLENRALRRKLEIL